MTFPLGLGPISHTIAPLQATPSLVTCSKVTFWACPHLSHHYSSTPLQLKMYVCFLKLFRALSVTPAVPQLFTHNQNEFLFPKAVQGTLSHPTAPQLSGLKNSRSACEFLFLQAMQPTLSHTSAALYWLIFDASLKVRAFSGNISKKLIAEKKSSYLRNRWSDLAEILTG